MKKFMLPLLIGITLFGCSQPKQTEEKSDKLNHLPDYVNLILENYKFSNWDSVQSIGFDFNVEVGDRKVLRQWEWSPKTNNVQLIENGDTVNFQSGMLDTAIKIEYIADQKFINDKFWLLFPFQLAWDSNLTFVAHDPSPMTLDSTTVLPSFTVTYPSEGGYTPGDAYKVYYDKTGTLKEWHFFPGGATEANVITTWEKINGNVINFTPFHQNPKTGFALYFTTIYVKTI
ncbi:MAG: hypothetical protein ACI81S_001062 [Sphingobacteriales bacterium]|jgi:hypothetical protein